MTLAIGKHNYPPKQARENIMTYSINQINGRLSNNQQIAFYTAWRELPYNHWKQQEYQWNFSGRKYRSPFSNAAYSNASRVITDLCHKPGAGPRGSRLDCSRRYVHYNIEGQRFGQTAHIYLILACDFNGVTLEYSINNALATTIAVRSNVGFHELDIVQYFQKHVQPTLYHAPGLFRDIQLHFNLDKKAALLKYQELMLASKISSEIDSDRAVLRHLRRHFNLIADGFWNINQLQQIATRYGKQSRKTYLEPQPQHHWFDTFDGDIDEIESNFYAEYERNRPTIFI